MKEGVWFICGNNFQNQFKMTTLFSLRIIYKVINGICP